MSVRVLRRGARGQAVELLQKSLNQCVVPPPRLEPDRIFGLKTFDAVQLFQGQNRLEVDGIAGPKTQAALFKMPKVNPITPASKQATAPANSTNLDGHLGKHISDFCGNGFVDESLNHCAHWVCHVRNIGVGYDCRQHTGGSEFGACIRVHSLFASCNQVGAWADKPATVTDCFVFITRGSGVNVTTKTMRNIPRKHVGIFSNNKVYHYSNTGNAVVSQTIEQFGHHYSPPYNDLFYGVR